MSTLDASDLVWPWVLATLLFLVLVGSGRTLRGRWLGRPPFGAGLALSAALGVMLFSLLWAGLGHFGALHAPWPWAVFGLAALLALPGLYWTWGDHRLPGPGLERGFGPAWFAGGAWLLLLAAIFVSLVWITAVHGYGGLGFLFERAGLDYAVGRTFFDPGMPRDPFLGDEPLDLWVYGLGSPLAGLALSWWLGIAILFGVCGLGWRLHHHGAGLAAAAVLAVVLFASDNILFLGPALPAALALIAVMVLAVESRGRPHVARSVVAGALGGFALVSDLGSAALLLPLLVFGPFWCKLATGLRVGEHGYYEGQANGGGPVRIVDERQNGGYQRANGGYGRPFDGGYGEDDDYDKLATEEKAWENGSKAGGLAKWMTPVRHTAFGVAGLALPLTPWLLRNDAWTDDPLYHLDARVGFESRADYRFLDGDPEQPGFQSGFRIGRQQLEWGSSERFRTRSQVDPIFLDYEVDFGPDLLDEGDFYRGYLDATELGLGIGFGALFAPLVVGGRRRRERLSYLLPGLGGYALGTWVGDFETTNPAALGLLSVGAGQALYGMKDCRLGLRETAMGGALASGGLAVGLSGANDCGYWPTWGDYGEFPTISLRSDPLQTEPPPGEEDEFGLRVGMAYRWDKYGFQPSYTSPNEEEEEDLPFELGVQYDYGIDLGLRYEYRSREQEPGSPEPHAAPTPEPGAATAPEGGALVPEDGTPAAGSTTAPQDTPGGPAADPEPEPDRRRPTIPTFRPDVRPDVQKNPSYPSPRTVPSYPRR